MSGLAAARKLRQQARATGKAKIGRCVLAEMTQPWKPVDGVPPVNQVRVREIESIIRSRHGVIIPDARDTDDLELYVNYVRAVALAGAGSFEGWARRWAPWLEDDVLFEQLVTAATKLASGKGGKYAMLGANALAKLLFVRMEERNSLSLKTIGACDVSAADRARIALDRKRKHDRDRQASKRRAENRRGRDEFLSDSIEGQKPWEAAGVSRRTWYRRRGTGPSRADININVGDTPVPTSSQDRFREISSSGEAAKAGVQGTRPLPEVREAEPPGAIDAPMLEVANG